MARSLSINLTITWNPPLKFNKTQGWRRLKRAAWYFFLVLLVMGLLLARDPNRLFHAQLWAEDGPLWVYDAYTTGLASLLTPHTGYLQTFPRLVGFLTVILPLAWIPAAFALVGLFTQVVPVALLLTARGRLLVPSSLALLLLVGYYIGVPNSFETFVNITNAQWHVVIILFLLVEMRLPESRIGRFAQYVFLVIAGLSGPFCFFLAPLAWWNALQATKDRQQRKIQAALLTLTVLVQGFCVYTSAGLSRNFEPLGATFGGFARILTSQIFLAGLAGAAHINRLVETPIWQHSDILPDVLVVFFLALTLTAFVKGPAYYKKFCILAGLILASALWSPVISTTQPQWIALEVPGAGSRYYLIPILAWFMSLLVLAADKTPALRWLARAFIVFSLVGVAADWNYPRQPETNFGQAAKAFEKAPPGKFMIFREAPDPNVWLFSLVKK